MPASPTTLVLQAIETLLGWQNRPLTGRPLDVRVAPFAPSLGELNRDTLRGFGKYCPTRYLPWAQEALAREVWWLLLHCAHSRPFGETAAARIRACGSEQLPDAVLCIKGLEKLQLRRRQLWTLELVLLEGHKINDTALKCTYFEMRQPGSTLVGNSRNIGPY